MKLNGINYLCAWVFRERLSACPCCGWLREVDGIRSGTTIHSSFAAGVPWCKNALRVFVGINTHRCPHSLWVVRMPFWIWLEPFPHYLVKRQNYVPYKPAPVQSKAHFYIWPSSGASDFCWCLCHKKDPSQESRISVALSLEKWHSMNLEKLHPLERNKSFGLGIC